MKKRGFFSKLSGFFFFARSFHLFCIIFNGKSICLKMFLLFMLMVKYFENKILSISQKKKLKKNLFKKLSNIQDSFSIFWQGILNSMKILNYFLVVSIDFSSSHQVYKLAEVKKVLMVLYT